jgi:hypothetical protein
MTLHAFLQRATDDQRSALKKIVELQQRTVGSRLTHAPQRALVRFDRDSVGDDAAYVDFVFSDEPSLKEVDALRDAILEDVRAQSLPLMIYVSAVLDSELDEHDRAL